MMAKSLFLVAALAFGLANGTSMLERPSMLCKQHGLIPFNSEHNPANPRNTNFSVCQPKHDPPVSSPAKLKAAGTRSLEGTDANIAETGEGVRRLQDFFSATFELNVEKLPARFTLEVPPWPGSYWAIAKDGLNFRWNPNDLSPSEKYAKAFNKDPIQMQNTISANSGIDSYSTNPKCTLQPGQFAVQGTCAFGSVCGTRRGSLNGYCIGLWEGICHAWAPASMLEPEPQCAVVKNGVRFEVLDIKGLITQVYYDSSESSIFTGARFDGNDNAPENAAKDQYGRFTNAARRDLGPGYFHLALTNVLGILHKTVIVDVTAGSQVWNHALMGYQIINTQYYADIRQAAGFYFNSNVYPFNTNAVHAMYIRNRVQYMLESDENGPLLSSGRSNRYIKTVDYDYLLELDANNNVIGGEWLYGSRDDHPDFLWVQMARPQDDYVAPSSGIQYGFVRELLETSLKC